MRTNGLNVQECRGKGCGQLLVFIRTKASNREKATPCEYPPVMRDVSKPLPEGVYYDMSGEYYKADEAPMKVPLYRAHWRDCPARDSFRKRKR